MTEPQQDKIKAIYTIIERDKSKKPYFMRIGTAMVNRDESLNLYFDAMPVNGKAHVRERWKQEGETRSAA